MTHIPDEAAESAQKRVALTTGLRDLAIYLDTHPGSPVPDVRAVFRLPYGPRGAQVDAVQEVADWLGVPVVADESGTLIASRNFGPLSAEARLEAEDPDVDLPLPAIPEFSDLADAALHWAGTVTPGSAA